LFLQAQRETKLFLALVWAATTAEGLRVFDCEDERSTVRSVDLTEPAKCDDPERDFEEPRNGTYQILQTDSTVPKMGYQCRITITKQVTRCGFNSLTYGTSWPA
jgi:hypothetical protein